MTWAGSYRATPTITNYTAASTYAVTKASGTVAGDLILLWVTRNAINTYSCPGFTAYTSAHDQVSSQLLVRVADGTEGSTFTVSPDSGSGTPSITQATIAGPCSIDVVGADNTTVGGTASTNLTALGLTVAGSNELLLWFGGVYNATLTAPPTGFTSRVSQVAATPSLAINLADNASVGSGATGNKSGTSANGYWTAQMVAIKPTAYAGPVYRAAPAVTNFTAATTYVVNKATGTVAGDIIILSCAGPGVGTYTCPGFAAGSSPSLGNLLYRTADGTEGSTFTITSPLSYPAAITQATMAGPCSIDVVGGANSGTSTNPSATGLTVAGSNELLLWFGQAFNSGNSNGTPVATTTPSGFTSRVTGTSGTSNLPDVLLCDNTAVASGATGSVAATNATTNIWQAQMVAINPAVVSTQGLLLMLMMS